MKKAFLYVALDYDSFKENFSFARELSTNVRSEYYGFKLNLDSVLNFGEDSLNAHDVVRELFRLERKIFVDLKMWNGGRTMENIAKGCAQLGVDIIKQVSLKVLGKTLSKKEQEDLVIKSLEEAKKLGFFE